MNDSTLDSPFEAWQRRLIAMAEDPPYVFVDTPDDLIAEHRRRLTTFESYSEAEIAQAERGLGMRLPDVFRAFWRTMGRSPGELFHGSDPVTPATVETFRRDACELLAATEGAPPLPDDAVVHCFHQGYQFHYFRCADPVDGPQWFWSEGEREAVEVAPSFVDWIEGRLRGMEASHRQLLERGGYYLTLFPDGGGKQHYPALASGYRPLDHALGGTAVPRRPGWFERVGVGLASLWRRGGSSS